MTNAATSVIMVVLGVFGWILIQRQLGAMETSNEIAATNYELAQRPWLVPAEISDLSTGVGLEGQTTIDLTVTFRNSGATPAIIDKALASIRVRVYPPEKPASEVTLHESIPATAGQTICHGGGIFLLPIKVHVPEGVTRRYILDSRFAFVVQGEVLYTDCFGKRRQTQFGFEHGRALGIPHAEPGWRPTPDNNAIT